MDVLSQEFPNVSFDMIPSEWPTKTGRWEFTQVAVMRRAQDCRQWLRSRPETCIAIVSHAGFLRLRFVQGTLGNAEYKVFKFEDDGDGLVEVKTEDDYGPESDKWRTRRNSY